MREQLVMVKVTVEGESGSLRQFLPVLQRPQVRVESVIREGNAQLALEIAIA